MITILFDTVLPTIQLSKLSCLFYHARWGEHINIAKLVLRGGEVFHLHQAFFHQRFQAVIQPADADTQFFGELALSEVWVFLQDAHHPEISVFLEFGLAAGHEIDALSLYGVSLNVFGHATALPCLAGHTAN
mgnify:CR=1 FL=1